MQTKRKDTYGRLFFVLTNDKNEVDDTDFYYRRSLDDFLRNIDDENKVRAFLPKSEWEPYLTPDRELVRYCGNLED